MTGDDGTFDSERDAGSVEHERLWQELGAVIAEASPVPPEVIQGGRDAFAWRTIDEELAALTRDSEADDAATTAVRATQGPRLLSFEAPGLTVEVEVIVQGGRRRLIGQLVPPQRALVTVRHHQGTTVTVEADEHGRFRAEDVTAGPTSLRCHLAGTDESASVVTDWITL